MQKEPGIWQKLKNFREALGEFMMRPKTIFDLKDRARLLIVLFFVIMVIELLLWLRTRM
ncbi:MAG: hypothetical protein SPI01_04220 [Succiniclasticum sp.]|nr:hypothetical protein [Succiniclasticum sp.]MDY6087182.1 hypothetical protein [Succiniclasticum sp.]